MKLTFLGHASFKISNGKVIYFDPYEINEGEKADIVLISHTHFDHESKEDIEKIKKENTIIITTTDTGIDGNVHKLKPGEEKEIDGIKIKAVPAYNIDKFKEPSVPFHPKQDSWNGYVIEIDGKKIYHAGDTDNIPELGDIECDIALLPVSGTYVMTADEAVEAALKIKPKIAIPMHYGKLVGKIEDAQLFKEKLEEKGISVKILQSGESLEL